jgi:hypothetical protein
LPGAVFFAVCRTYSEAMMAVGGFPHSYLPTAVQFLTQRPVLTQRRKGAEEKNLEPRYLGCYDYELLCETCSEPGGAAAPARGGLPWDLME